MILSKWLVLQEHEVGGGAVADETVAAWVDAAIAEYLGRCTTLTDRGLKLRIDRVPAGALLGHPASVAVTATVAEVKPAMFTVSVRLRPLDGERETPVDARCVVSIVDPATGELQELGRPVRDELIALEHSATHYN